MNPSPLAAPVHRIIVVSRLMPNHCPLCSIPQTFWKLHIPYKRCPESLDQGKNIGSPRRWTRRREGRLILPHADS
ncbi:hypothetical protein NC651_039192 [Populus alba x Populus x berolinensis]|nr:hypothetical protein NC651_039192 [Populus alba x Populus x berolinensis]